jgi:Ca-activated chloride channel family protein
MNKPWKMIAAATAAALVAGCSSSGTGYQTLTHDQAVEQINSYVQTGKVRYTEVTHGEDTSWVGVDTSADELPSIDKYPLSVEGRGQINVEIFSSTEKSNAKSARWLDVMAQRFNDSDVTIGGSTISVSVRPIASGLALDYIKSRKYVPGAYSPSNELWGAMIDSTGLKTQLVEKRLTGNVAGILMKEATHKSFTKKYGQATIANIVKAAQAGDLKLGHTDPNQSSTGLNIFTQELLQFDSANPLSQTAVEAFKKFQATVPPTSPTTDEMSKVAAKGILDAMIMEAQAYTSEPSLATGWVFTPAGVRHDSPLYALGNLSADQITVLRKFADYSLSSDGQQAATSFGFNQHDTYAGVTNKYTGAQLFSALDLWKQNKDAGRPVVSVFVVDRSGSMDGNRLIRAKEALRNAAAYINPGNYVGPVSYSDENSITLDTPIGQFDDRQRSLFAGAINDLTAAGGTATNSALIVGLKLMLDKQASVADAKLRIIVMSDGEQNAGLSLEGTDNTLGIVDGLDVPVYGVGFEANLTDLTKLADPNEGYVINADSDDVASRLKGLLRKEL